MLQDLLDGNIILLLRNQRQNCISWQVLILVKNLFCGCKQRYTHNNRITILSLSRHILYSAVDDATLSHTIQVTYTASHKALKYEYIPLLLECRIKTEIRTIHLLSLIYSYLDRRPIHTFLNLEMLERISSGQFLIFRPFK